MKKLISRLLVAIIAVLSTFALAACGKREPCLVSLPTVLPEGVQEISCSASFAEDGVTSPGTAYGGSLSITVTLKDGYNMGSLALTVDEADAALYGAFKEKIVSGSQIEYKFENVKKSFSVGFTGTAALNEYQVTLKFQACDTETLFNSTNFQYVITSGATETKSEIFTGAALKTHIGEGKAITVHHGDKVELSATYSEAYGAVFSGFVNTTALYEQTFRVPESGKISTTITFIADSSVELKINENSFDVAENLVSTWLMFDGQSTGATPIVLDGETVFKEGSPTIADFAEKEKYNLAIDLENIGIIGYTLTNYSDEKLKVFVNGKEIEKTSITISNGALVILDQPRPYEFVDLNGTTTYIPSDYEIEIKGVQEFVEEKKDEFSKIEYSVTTELSGKAYINLDTHNINDYIYNSDVVLDVSLLEDATISLEATDKDGNIITISNLHEMENATPAAGVVVEKLGAGLNFWKVTFDKSLNIRQAIIK